MIAYATFAHSPPESLLTAVSEHALLSLSKFEQQAIANLIWALALLHALTPHMWNQLLEAFSNVDGQQGKLLQVFRRPLQVEGGHSALFTVVASVVASVQNIASPFSDV